MIKNILNTKEFENKLENLIDVFMIKIEDIKKEPIDKTKKDKKLVELIINLKASAIILFVKELRKYINIGSVIEN